MRRSVESHDICCKVPTTACPCPICGNPGRQVAALTLDHHAPPALRAGFGDEATFCLNPACDVVYCNTAGKTIRHGQTVLPVTIKDPGDDVYVCYCFRHKRGDIRRDLAEKGKTDIPDEIKKGIREGSCDCERQNPQGACCLGNVARAVQLLKIQPGGSPS